MTNANEQLVSIANEHWVKFVAPMIAWITMTGASIALFLVAGVAATTHGSITTTSFMLASILLLFAHHALFYKLLSDDLDQMTITSKRIVAFHTNLFLHDDIMEIPLEKMKVVHADKHGVLQNILNYGTLTFDPHGTVHRIPHPHRVARDIAHILEMK